MKYSERQTNNKLKPFTFIRIMQKKPEAVYLTTNWFEKAGKDKGKSFEQLKDKEVLKFGMQFNAYGVDPQSQQEYFLKYYENVNKVILKLTSQQLNDFKFKFIGWKKINPTPFLQGIAKQIQTSSKDNEGGQAKRGIRPYSLNLNLSNIPGSLELLKYIFRGHFYATTHYQSISLNFSNWKLNQDAFEEVIFKTTTVSGPKMVYLDFSGWGKDITLEESVDDSDALDVFFKIDVHDKNRVKLRQEKLTNFHQSLKDYVTNDLLANDPSVLLIDMRNWSKLFKLADLKKEFDKYFTGHQKQESIISKSNKTQTNLLNAAFRI